MQRRTIPGFTALTLLLAGIAVVAVPHDDAAAQEAREVAELSGEWRLTDRNAERTIDREITRVTNQMNMFIGRIARSRLQDAVDPEEHIRIDPEGDHVRVVLGSWGPVRLPLDGRVVSADTDDGTTLRASAQISRGQLTIQQMTDEGSRVCYFQLRGDQLTVAMRLRSERLPEDIVYHLRYQRAGPPQIASR